MKFSSPKFVFFVWPASRAGRSPHFDPVKLFYKENFSFKVPFNNSNNNNNDNNKCDVPYIKF